MKKLTAFPISTAFLLPLFLIAQIGSPQITTPVMELVKADDIEAREMRDGRVTQRISAATVGLIKVEWPAGTSTNGAQSCQRAGAACPRRTPQSL